MLTQLEALALVLMDKTNGADAALVRQASQRIQQAEVLIQNLKACVLSMSPTDFTNDEFCQQTLQQTHRFFQGEHHGETPTAEHLCMGSNGSKC